MSGRQADSSPERNGTPGGAAAAAAASSTQKQQDVVSDTNPERYLGVHLWLHVLARVYEGWPGGWGGAKILYPYHMI